jgi:hypothetical protein
MLTKAGKYIVILNVFAAWFKTKNAENFIRKYSLLSDG